jgi:hypothetical protein
MADVSPGDVLDATNWEKAEALLPEPILEWVKKGDFILEVGALNFRPLDFFPPFQLEAFTTSLGKYELDPAGGIIEVGTTRLPDRIVGLPFPKVAPEDPRLPEKLMQNNHYMQYIPGNLRFPFEGLYLTRSGFERESGSADGHGRLSGGLGSPEPAGHREVRHHGREDAL